MSPRTLRSIAALLLACAGLAGCATHDRSSAFRLFRLGRYADARASYEAEIVKGGPSVTLDRSSAATAALLDGDVEGAHRQFQEAFADLDDLSATTGETVTAIVGPERSKRWKGDPFERCMNAYYLGITYWLLGDVDNAAASFKAGLLRDGDSQEGAARSDFALLWYLMGQAQRAARHSDRGEAALATARELVPANPWLQGAAADANVVLVVEIGIAPEKVPTGAHGAWVKFVRRGYRAAGADVFDGGTHLGSTAFLEDMHHQAMTRGDKLLDHVNQGKAVFKTAAGVAGAVILSDHNRRSNSTTAVGAALLAVSLLTPSEADVRQWDVLPGEVHVFTAHLPPGRHVLEVQVYDSAGNRLPGLDSQVLLDVEEGQVAFGWTRAAPPPVQSVPTK